MDEKLTMSLTILLTGFVVVFMVLLLLIFIIKIYSTIVYNAQNKPKKNKKNDDDETPKGTGVGGGASSAPSSSGVSPDVLACIAAAVEYIYGAGSVRIKNIRKAGSHSAWGRAGVVANTRPF